MTRIFLHLYHGHYDKFLHLSVEAHLNTLFAHFICFGRTFDLLDENELTFGKMGDLIQLWIRQGTLAETSGPPT